MGKPNHQRIEPIDARNVNRRQIREIAIAAVVLIRDGIARLQRAEPHTVHTQVGQEHVAQLGRKGLEDRAWQARAVELDRDVLDRRNCPLDHGVASATGRLGRKVLHAHRVV
jgi:hypothetical protein